MINTEMLEREIYSCGWSDLTWFNGVDHPRTPAYSPEEQKAMMERKIFLEKKLDHIKEINEKALS